MTENEHINRKCEAIEQKVGYRLRTPKDFERLHTQLFEDYHVMISTSTLKRLWGYVQSSSSPRLSSLDQLVKALGYKDWEDFVQQNPTEAETPAEATPPVISADTPAAKPKKRTWPTGKILVSLVVALVAVGYLLMRRDGGTDTTAVLTNGRVLHKGRVFFQSIDDYLPLFGIEKSDTPYFRPLPGLEYVYVWGPEYGNAIWHNEGDSALLMPTITEYYTPHGQSRDYTILANEKLYYERKDKQEVRITFMRDIVDSTYLFLGIYVMDQELSTPEKFVWKRVCDSLDLAKLPQLENLRY